MKMKLICLGDSLTYGYGVSRRETWTALSADALGIEVVNAGVSGDTTGGMLSRFQREVVDAGGSHVFLMGGANDILLSGETGPAKANLGAMAYRAMSEGIVPVFGLPPRSHPMVRQTQWGQVFDFVQADEKLEELIDWICRFASGFGISTVDFRGLFGTPPEKAYYLDGLHMTALGNRRMAEQFIASFPLRKGQH